MARRECRNCAKTASALVVSLLECRSGLTNLPRNASTGRRAANSTKSAIAKPPPRATAQSAMYNEYMGHCPPSSPPRATVDYLLRQRAPALSF